jgi:putative ATPase
VAAALGAVTAAVRDRRIGPVPMHLRDAHYRGAQTLGHGEGYVYPHDAPQGWVPQAHLPAEVAGEQFYRPSAHGAEPALFAALEARRGQQVRREEADDDAAGDDARG